MYRIHEVFASVQGEGRHVGRPVVFVRFAGCNLECPFCDTPRVDGEEWTGGAIEQEVKLVGGPIRSVIFTGGEPLLQLDEDLLRRFKDLGYWIGIETNGTIVPPLGITIDWVTVSPKTLGEVNPWYGIGADEVRFPIQAGDRLPSWPWVAEKYLSPIFDGMEIVPDNVDHAMRLVKENPGWRLSVQVHKLIGIR